jgi:hypothetical protein
MLYVPIGFDWSTNVMPGLKGIRFTQPAQTSKIEHFIGDRGGSGANSGVNLLSEFQGAPDAYATHDLDRVLIPGQWNWLEVYCKASDVPSECDRRVWINDEMIIERTAGVNNRYHTSEGWQTQTHYVPEYILPNDASYINGTMVFTYWNGYAPTSQKLWIQRIVMHKTADDLSSTDEFGNKMIGSVVGMGAV